MIGVNLIRNLLLVSYRLCFLRDIIMLTNNTNGFAEMILRACHRDKAVSSFIVWDPLRRGFIFFIKKLRCGEVTSFIVIKKILLVTNL